jgi:hypothetical protein
LLLVACSPRIIDTCADDLHGVWRDPAGRDWMMLDHGSALEAYPVFADAVPAAPDVVPAPRVIDLTRAGSLLEGTAHRRFARRADACDARVPIHVLACRDRELELVVAEPAAPLAFAPCSWGPPPPSKTEHWHLQ